MLRRLLETTCATLLWGAACATTVLAQAPNPSPAVRPDPQAPKGQLSPGGPTPSAYRLDLTILPDEARFSGHAEIDVAMPAGARRVYMHGRDLAVSNAVVRVGGRTIPATFTQVDPTGVARLDLADAAPGGEATLVFDYSAPFGETPSGMYHIKVGDRWYAWTQFESTDARAAYPSFDEPGFKTPFTISVTTRPGLTVVSNAPQASVSPAPGGMEIHRFAPTRPLPTYLLAIDTGPFAHPASSIPPDPQRASPLPLGAVATQAQADKTAFVLAQTPPIVKLLEAYFGQPFPFPKLDQIGSPEMPGAMENAGADTYADDLIFLDKDATTRQQQLFGMVVSHELSHQWFGDLVSPAWWDDIWLNESFANWMGYRIGDAWRPDLHIGAQALSEGFSAMNTDALEVGRPIHQHIATNGEIDSAFDTITYGKGGQVVAMIAAYMGDDAFRAGVRLHLSRHMYGNATTDQFFTALADSAHDPRILAAMKSFVDQQGVPLVTFTRSGAGFTATQSRYTLLGGAQKDQRWIIPLCLDDAGKRTCTLLDRASAPIAAPASGPLIPNAGGTGYYRFDMPATDWATLIAALPNLPTGEALAADDSLWASFDAGRAPAAALVNETRTIVGNPDAEASVAPSNRWAALRRRGLVAPSALSDYRRFMQALYAPRLRQIGFDPAAGVYAAETPDKQQLRASLVGLVAVEAQDAPTRAKLVAAAQRYLTGNARALDQAFMWSAFRAYVEAGGVPAAEALVAKALASEDTFFRNAAMGTVSTTGRPDVAKWALAFADPRERPNERLSLIGGLAATPETKDAAIDYILVNYDKLAVGNGVFVTSRLPGMLSNACSGARADQIESILGPKVRALGAGVLDFERTVERVRRCGELKAARSANIALALKSAAS